MGSLAYSASLFAETLSSISIYGLNYHNHLNIGGKRLTEWYDLTERQREAILHRGSPLLIIAGPGSGKTEIIAWRVANLIKTRDAASDKVLVTTFTDKAALELKDRIQKKVPHLNVDAIQVSTIHSFCLKILLYFYIELWSLFLQGYSELIKSHLSVMR